MLTVMIICIVIIFVVILLTVITTSKAYSFEHKVDPLPKREKDDIGNDQK